MILEEILLGERCYLSFRLKKNRKKCFILFSARMVSAFFHVGLVKLFSGEKVGVPRLMVRPVQVCEPYRTKPELQLIMF